MPVNDSANRKVITIDGFAGTGKSTISKLFAEKINYVHLNTGLLYRAIAVELKSCGIQDTNDTRKIEQAFSNLKLVLDFDRSAAAGASEKKIKVYRNGQEFNADFYSSWASENSSRFSSLPVVRDFLMSAQREAFPGKNLVAEGRDQGTVVFPDANLKFYVSVELKIRAERRLKQLTASQPAVNNQEIPSTELIMRDIEERDKRDSSRAIAPTIPAKDAIFIDNSHKSLTDVLDEMYHHASLRGLV